MLTTDVRALQISIFDHRLSRWWIENRWRRGMSSLSLGPLMLANERWSRGYVTGISKMNPMFHLNYLRVGGLSTQNTTQVDLAWSCLGHLTAFRRGPFGACWGLSVSENS